MGLFNCYKFLIRSLLYLLILLVIILIVVIVPKGSGGIEFFTVSSCDEWNSLSTINPCDVDIGSGVCNELNIAAFSLTSSHMIRNLLIHSNSFGCTKMVYVVGAPILANVTIDRDSFNTCNNYIADGDHTTRFQIKSCPQLKTLIIKGNSFHRFAGPFELSGRIQLSGFKLKNFRY